MQVCSGKKRSITKEDIGLATDFEHRVHVGWNPAKGIQSTAESVDDLVDDDGEDRPRPSATNQPVRPSPAKNAPRQQTQITSNNIIIPTSDPVAGDLFTSTVGKNKAANRKANKKDKKRTITKSDISLPTNFEHRVHVGWDPAKGIQTTTQSAEDLDPVLLQLLDTIKLPESELHRPETKNFIYDFIEKSGRMEQLRKEMAQPPPVALPPTRSTSQPGQSCVLSTDQRASTSTSTTSDGECGSSDGEQLQPDDGKRRRQQLQNEFLETRIKYLKMKTELIRLQVENYSVRL